MQGARDAAPEPGGQVVQASRKATERGALRTVEQVGPLAISGWVIDHKRPLAPLHAELVVGGHVAVAAAADRPHPGVSEAMGFPVRAGFAFGVDAIEAPQQAARTASARRV